MSILSSIFGHRTPIETPSETTGIFGDIHANTEAFDAVLSDMKQRGTTRFLCTGDVVDYGADPSRCILRLRELKAACVQGNHDEYITETIIPNDVNPSARQSILWTQKTLTDREKEWLFTLPLREKAAGIGLVHSSYEPNRNWPYITTAEQAAPSLNLLPGGLAFYGHTHRPMIFIQTPRGRIKRHPSTTVRLKPGHRYFINPGSVGQPRDEDPRASYALFDPQNQSVSIRRVDYNIKAAAEKIRSAGLPDRNADRLFIGK